MNKEKIAQLASIIVVLTGFADTYFDLLQSAGFALQTINQIKLFGLVLAVILPGLTPFIKNKNNA